MSITGAVTAASVVGGVMTGSSVSVTGNITGSYIIGNGSQLTGLPAGYSNSNASSFLAAFGSNVISTTGTITSGNITSGNVLTGGLVSATGTVTGSSFLGSVVSITGAVTAASVVGGVMTGSSVSVTGTATAASVVGGVMTGTSVSASGNVTSGNVLTGGLISAAGQVSANTLYVSSNANILGNLNVQGNITFINSNVITTNDLYIELANNQTTYSNINGAGFNVGPAGSALTNWTYNSTANAWSTNVGVSVTANVIGGNITTAGLVSATGTITGSSHLGTVVSASGNVTGGNVLTGGSVSATGNITGSYIIGNGSQLTGLPAGYSNSNASSFLAAFGSNVISTTGTITSGNITSGNVLTGGLVSATGNITGSYLFGNGSQITGLPAGYSNATAASFLAAFGSNTISSTGTITTTANITGGNVLTGGLVSVTGNVTVGNVLTGGLVSATGTITGSSHLGTVVSASGNVTGGNVLTGGLLSVTGNITAGNLSVSTGTVTVGNIVNGGTSAVGNIGSTTVPFNTIFAKATSAQYADLAENYLADAVYAAGTVVSFGGDLEITASTADSDTRVAGVVSTNPSYLMNGGLVGDNVVAVALTGRVPCRVTGVVRKGDLMVSNGDGTARAEANPAVGTVIGKALADFDGVTGVVEVVVGRV